MIASSSKRKAATGTAIPIAATERIIFDNYIITERICQYGMD